MKKMISVLCIVALIFVCPVFVFAADVSWTPSSFVPTVTFGDTSLTQSGASPYSYFYSSGPYTLDSFYFSSDSSDREVVIGQLPFDGVFDFKISGFGHGTYNGSLFIGFDFANTDLFFSQTIGVNPTNFRRSLPVSMTYNEVTYRCSLVDTLPSYFESYLYYPGSSSFVPVPIDRHGRGFMVSLNDVFFSSDSESYVVLRLKYRYVLNFMIYLYASNPLSDPYLPAYLRSSISLSDTPVFTGRYTEGDARPDSDTTASLIIDNDNKLAVQQERQEEARHQDLISGYDDLDGQVVNKDLQDGFSAYESEEDQAHQDFNDKMDAYEDPDIGSYLSGVTFISSAVVMWWNSLGMFQIILLIGFSLMIFNYISRFRGG